MLPCSTRVALVIFFGIALVPIVFFQISTFKHIRNVVQRSGGGASASHVLLLRKPPAGAEFVTTHTESSAVASTTVVPHDPTKTRAYYDAARWNTRLAMRRASDAVAPSPRVDRGADGGDGGGASTRRRFAAVLLQVGYPELLEDLVMCTANVAAAASREGYAIDIYVALHADISETTPGLVETIRDQLTAFESVGRVTLGSWRNAGADVRPFLKQLEAAASSGRKYDLILKQHTKGDDTWRARHVESLCGTPEHVRSIWKQFQDDPSLGMVSPLGTTFGDDSQANTIYPHIARKYNWVGGGATTRSAFDRKTVENMRAVYSKMYGRDLKEESSTIVAGTTFWARYEALDPEAFVRVLPEIDGDFSKGYVVNHGMEHFIERLLPSSVKDRGWTLAEAPPAPRVLAMVFPQFHAFKENDRFWGKGFTEWTLLKPLQMKGLHKPLPVDEGGLGYYNMLDLKTRKRQGDLAREAGMTGFVFYHYWFSGSHAPPDHKVMYKVQEAMLLDGEPNMPFMLSWANEPWERRWTGTDANADNILLSQDYGDEDEWAEHFEYLLKFFEHPNYIQIEKRPVFVIYRIGHVGEKLKPMLDLWTKLAVEKGFVQGIKFIHTIGNFYSSDKETKNIEKTAGIEGAFHFWPQLLGGGFLPNGQKMRMAASVEDLKVNVPMQYWGAFTGFDRRPRDNKAFPIQRTVEEFGTGLAHSFTAMAGAPQREIDLNLFFVTAWNEWNEQATLEPDDVHGTGYLDVIRSNLESVPVGKVPHLNAKKMMLAKKANNQNPTKGGAVNNKKPAKEVPVGKVPHLNAKKVTLAKKANNQNPTKGGAVNNKKPAKEVSVGKVPHLNAKKVTLAKKVNNQNPTKGGAVNNKKPAKEVNIKKPKKKKANNNK